MTKVTRTVTVFTYTLTKVTMEAGTVKASEPFKMSTVLDAPAEVIKLAEETHGDGNYVIVEQEEINVKCEMSLVDFYDKSVKVTGKKG